MVRTLLMGMWWMVVLLLFLVPSEAVELGVEGQLETGNIPTGAPHLTDPSLLQAHSQVSGRASLHAGERAAEQRFHDVTRRVGVELHTNKRNKKSQRQNHRPIHEHQIMLDVVEKVLTHRGHHQAEAHEARDGSHAEEMEEQFHLLNALMEKQSQIREYGQHSSEKDNIGGVSRKFLKQVTDNAIKKSVTPTSHWGIVLCQKITNKQQQHFNSHSTWFVFCFFAVVPSIAFMKSIQPTSFTLVRIFQSMECARLTIHTLLNAANVRSIIRRFTQKRLVLIHIYHEISISTQLRAHNRLLSARLRKWFIVWVNATPSYCPNDKYNATLNIISIVVRHPLISVLLIMRHAAILQHRSHPK